MIPLPEKPRVQIYYDRERDVYTVKTNVSPDLEVDIVPVPYIGEEDQAAFQGLPFEVKVS